MIMFRLFILFVLLSLVLVACVPALLAAMIDQNG